MFRIAIAALLMASTVQAEEIPLKNVWALNMPGTRDIRDLLEADGERSKLDIIVQALKDRRDIGSAFAVEGTGTEALNRIYNIVTQQKSISDSLPSGEVSVAFFTKYTRYYVRISEVTVGPKNNIQIVFELLPHREEQRTLYLALIPLGKLPAGKYDIAIAPKPIAKEFIEDGFKGAKSEEVEQTVSSSFTLKID